MDAVETGFWTSRKIVRLSQIPPPPPPPRIRAVRKDAVPILSPGPLAAGSVSQGLEQRVDFLEILAIFTFCSTINKCLFGHKNCAFDESL